MANNVNFVTIYHYEIGEVGITVVKKIKKNPTFLDFLRTPKFMASIISSMLAPDVSSCLAFFIDPSLFGRA